MSQWRCQGCGVRFACFLEEAQCPACAMPADKVAESHRRVIDDDSEIGGCTFRAYASIAAMQGIIQAGRTTPKDAAKSAVQFADALVEALNEPRG